MQRGRRREFLIKLVLYMNKDRQIPRKPLRIKHTTPSSLYRFHYTFALFLLQLADLSWYLYCTLPPDLGILFTLNITEQFISFHIDLAVVLYINIKFKNKVVLIKKKWKPTIQQLD